LVFLPPGKADRRRCEQVLEKIVAEEGQRFLGWRTVPTNNASLGDTARKSEPFIRQVFIGRNRQLADDMAFERKLFVIRKRAANETRGAGLKGANPGHTGEPLADRWGLNHDLEQVAQHWGVDPKVDLVCTHAK
jgi:glutamate synthase (ferredoxin)